MLVWAITVIVALLVSTGVRVYALGSYFIPSPSMTPTLMVGDHIIVDKLALHIHRGDIVVFNRVQADRGGPPVLVKRVIGLPGDTISTTGNEVFIDDKPLQEPWLPVLLGQCASAPVIHVPDTKIPPDHYFVMGDCRGNSDDSRDWGTVPDSNIIGKVDAIIWRDGRPWIHWF